MSRSLEQWEVYLSKAMPRVRLLSELGLNYEDMLEIANLIKGENAKHKNVRQTTRVVVDDFPCTFVGFLAAFAAQNTEREFWDAVARLINVTGMELNNAHWRNHFIEILQQFKKPVFENLSFVYVANMRIHGGIPSYSLRDFFANMLMPSIENPEYIELKGKELRDALLSRSAVQMFTDSTVRNFFENTEEIGVEYLEACRRVAKSYNSSRQIPNLHGLPSYVVDKLVNFIEYQEDEKRGLRRPRIKFDAEGEGLLLELPEEPLSSSDVYGNQVYWQVYQNKILLKEQRAPIYRRGRDVHSQEQLPIPLGYIVEPFQVTFSILDQDGNISQIREWTFELRSQDTPNLLVFRSEDGSLMHWSQALPAHDLLLVHLKDISLEFEGEARLIHSPDIYAEGWHNWKAEYCALAGAFSLSLIQNGETLAVIPIQKQLELPRLIGNVFTPNLDPKTLYIGAAPTLRIPLRPGVAVNEELKRWRVEINSSWEAEPFIHQNFKLSVNSEYVISDESVFEFDLGAVLGKEPKGTYTLRVRGPLEIDIEIPFRVWSALQIKDVPEFILPTEEQKITLHFVIPAHAFLEPQVGTTGINITGQQGQYAVELDETVSKLELNLTWSLETSVIHVPFSLPIPRIEWRLVLGEDSKVEWSNRSIRKPVDAFLQSTQTVALLVQMPGIEKHTDLLVLRLIDPEKPKEPLQEFPVQPSVLGSDHVRFLLNAKDTVNQHKDVSVFEFQLLLVNKEGLYQPVNLVSLTREIDVSNVRIEETREGLLLLWDEPSPLRNRRVFIRSIWKLLADAWNVKIPDDARGKFDLLAAGYSLPPSWYEVHFYVAPSWEKDITSAPENSTYVVKTISPEDQIAWLDSNLQKHLEQSFVNHFERACIYTTIGEAAKRDEEIQFCYSHIDQSKQKDLFAFHEWLEKYDSNTRRAIRMKMYNPEQLRRLFATYKPGEEFRQKYQSYVSETSLKPDSAILLLENENDPSLVFHALRELVKKRDHRFLSVITKMLEVGRLSDADAIKLLLMEEEHFLSELNASELDTINLRLLSGLLRNKDSNLSALSNEKIISLVKAELDKQTIDKYLRILIVREDKRGVEFAMDLFKRGQLPGNEVTELLGVNPSYSFQVLSSASQDHDYSVQLSELVNRFPLETGHVTLGMLVKTPVGWGEITRMVDKKGVNCKITLNQEKQIMVYYIIIEVGMRRSIEAIINMQEQILLILSSMQVYKCGYCDYASTDQRFITRYHTRESHPGMSPSFRPIPSHMTIHDELQFRESPHKTLTQPQSNLKTVFGTIATDRLSIAGAMQRQKKKKIN